MSKILSVVSGKGGTGKSTVTAAVSVALAEIGHSVLAVDFDVCSRSMDILLGLTDQIVFDLGDVLAGRCSLESAVVGHPNILGLSLLCAPLSLSREFSIPAALRLIQGISAKFDYVLLDLPAGLEIAVLTKEITDLFITVTSPELISVRAAQKTADLLLSDHPKPMRLVINKVCRDTMQSNGLSDLDEVMDITALPLLGVLPFDPFINTAVAGKNGRHPKTQMVFSAMAQRIAGQYVPLIIREV